MNTRCKSITSFSSLVLFALASCFTAQLGCNTTPLGGTGSNTAGDSLAGTPLSAEAAAGLSSVTRDIEEADIIKIVDGKLYALNRYKGLLIIDVANPDAPALLGTFDLKGRGIEMYVSDNQAYIVLSADYAVYYGGGGGEPVPLGAPGTQSSTSDVSILPGPPIPAPDFEGSQLAIINVANPAVPQLVSKINLAGFANESRRVGDIIYVVGANDYPFYFRQGDDNQVDSGFVASIDVGDPANVVPVQRKTFGGTSLDIHVSDELILAASHEYDPDTSGTNTLVQAIDISDPTGVIALRGTTSVPGMIRNRFFLDDYLGVMRIVTESNGFGFADVKLFTYDLADLDAIVPIASVLIKQGESLEAVRFDGDRGYAVTFFRTDPLFVLDLADPANPLVAGQLEVPGYSTHIEPRGDRLIAVGIDDTDGSRPALAYYDVTDPANPTQLGRVVLGPPGSYTESDATYDEKAFKIIDELNLIVMPFRHVEYPDVVPVPGPGGSSPPSEGGSEGSSDTTAANEVQTGPTCTNGVQLVDFSDTALTARGFFENKGKVERVGVIGSRVFALSQAQLQTMDITDRDSPTQVGHVEFFTEAEAQLFDDCNFYYGLPIDNVVGGSDGFAALAQLLSQYCGSTSVTPMMMLAACLMFFKTTGHGIRRR
ncbi:MAG: beta-propeller domain-containing protein [Planctomycetota bacterium]